MRLPSFQQIIVALVLLSLSACNGYEQVLKSNDVNYKLSRANTYFDKKQYQKANGVYESLLPLIKGTKSFEPLYFKYAYTSFYLKDYLSASYLFKNFGDYFPASKDAEEAEYMHALCLYKDSPKFSLEQTSTIKAMEAMQSYINMHPDSKRLVDANAMIDEMRKKLEMKDATAAKLYYNIGQYKASSIAYKSVLQAYPESVSADYYQYMIVKSTYNFAKASVVEKQEERYASAISAYNDLKESFPKSKYIEEADKYHTQANDNLKKLHNEHK